MKHDEIIKQVRALAKKVDRNAVAGAWLAGLGTKPSPWRAPLSALAPAERVPSHSYRAFSASSPSCRECGALPVIDLDDEEMSERGEILPGDLAQAYPVLVWFRAQPEPPRPTPADAKRLTRILKLVGELPASAREGKLNEALRAEKLVLGNKYDVRSVIETLGALGILETPEHPGFTTKWTSFGARQDRPSVRVECDPPIAFWMAGHGVNATRVAEWFGSFGVKTPASSKPRALPVAKASASQARRAKRAARSTELELGDVIAAQIGSVWRAAIVIGHARDLGGRTPFLQPSTWRGDAPPSAADIRSAPRVNAWCQTDLWVRDDPKGTWRTIGTIDANSPPKFTPHTLFSAKRDGIARFWEDCRPLVMS
jgi:hypothetical protein